MLYTLSFIMIGYLSGSILYARIFLKLSGKETQLEQSVDGNLGTANAYHYGGFLCGTLTLAADLLKGFLPVYIFLQSAALPDPQPFLFSLMVAAPVIGHIFPVFYRFRGGKGIAASFGCLAGLFPEMEAFISLASFFIFYSVLVKISPHYYRTAATYLSLIPALAFGSWPSFIKGGTMIIALAVLTRLYMSKEQKGNPEVTLLGHTHTFMRDRRRT